MNERIYVDAEDVRRAANRVESAASSVSSSASSISESTHTLGILLGSGYGSNVERLIDLLSDGRVERLISLLESLPAKERDQ